MEFLIALIKSVFLAFPIWMIYIAIKIKWLEWYNNE